MGCTPSVLPQGESGTRDKATLTGPSGSPRTWRFRRSGEKVLKSIRNSQQSKIVSDYRLFRPANNVGSPVKVLLVFPRDDFQSDAFWLAAEKLGYDCTMARSRDSAVESYNTKYHDIVVVDNRQQKLLDGETTLSSLLSYRASQYSVFAAVVPKPRTEQEEPVAQSFLAMGCHRVIIETSSVGTCTNELLTLEKTDLQTRVQLAASQVVFLALDKCREVVHITDNSHRVQYANRAAEKLLGFRQGDLLGRNLLDMNLVDNRDLMTTQLAKGREWEGTMTLQRRSADSLALSGRAIPAVMAGRLPTHYVFIHEPPPMMNHKFPSQTSVSARESGPRGSINSARKASSDVRSISSDGLRRQSMSKLHTLSMEAPITKVITLITAAQESANDQVAQTLEKVVEILRTTELYAPMMKEERVRAGDAVTTDLIGALLLQGGTPSNNVLRRSSNESTSTIRPSTVLNARAGGKLYTVSSHLKDILDKSLHWEFDIFKLETLSSKRPLVHLGMKLLTQFDVPATLNCDEATMHNWLVIIEANYHSSNSYHNSTHAADVMQASAAFLCSERIKQVLDPYDNAMVLISAAGHDVGHPGKSSAFLCNCNHDLAILYNDICVLESHHSALTFKLTMSDDRVNIFKGLDSDTYKMLRQGIIDMILATEMTKHFEHLAKFVNVFNRPSYKDEDTGIEVVADLDMNVLTLPENMSLMKRMLIKCADVSNPARPVTMCVEWAIRIAEEYFDQTDEEKARSLPVVMPLFDRTTCSIPKSQIGFMDFIINDMFEAWESFIEMPIITTYIANNYEFWKEKEIQGIHSIHDIIKIHRGIAARSKCSSGKS